MEMPPFDELLPLPPAAVTLDSPLARSAGARATWRRSVRCCGSAAARAARAAPVRALAELRLGRDHQRQRPRRARRKTIRSRSVRTRPRRPSRRSTASCDAMVVVGSRLRGNETLRWEARLPANLYQIDVDRRCAAARIRCGTSSPAMRRTALTELVELLGNGMAIDPGVRRRLRARAPGRTTICAHAGPLRGAGARARRLDAAGALWVRDVTVSNSSLGQPLSAAARPARRRARGRRRHRPGSADGDRRGRRRRGIARRSRSPATAACSLVREFATLVQETPTCC